jgi:AcrR family transcriptional regulator
MTVAPRFSEPAGDPPSRPPRRPGDHRDTFLERLSRWHVWTSLRADGRFVNGRSLTWVKVNGHLLFVKYESSTCMSPRPRTVADGDILTATAAVMSRLGPARLTLADVAKEVGLSPATLVQRFGSKRGLLLAVAEVAAGGMDEAFAMVRAAHPSPLEALLDCATFLTRHSNSPEELVNHLAFFLQIDVSDPDFYRHTLLSSRATLAGYKRLLQEAIEEGELVECDTAALARIVSAVAGGSLMAWAVFREGAAEAWVRKDLEAVLAPYRVGATRGRKRPHKRNRPHAMATRRSRRAG